MHNVAIIGSGRRVQQNFLPALCCLRNHFNLVGIFSRTYNNARCAAEKWGCEAFETFECIPLHNISVVAISITSQGVPEILRKLEAYPKKLTVVLDTPALASFRHLNILRRVSQRHRVLVAEDFMNFPQFHLMRKALESGLIGKVKSISMRQSGYLYHGTAYIRSLIGFRPICAMSTLFSDGALSRVSFRFKGGVQATMTYPYIPEAGCITVIGSKGILTTAIETVEADIPVHYVRPITDAHGVCGFSINDEFSIEMSNIDKLRDLPLDDKSDFNLQKTWGLAEIFKDIDIAAGINNRYGLREGVYDSILGKMTKAPFIVDPLGCLGTHAFTPIFKAQL